MSLRAVLIKIPFIRDSLLRSKFARFSELFVLVTAVIIASKLSSSLSFPRTWVSIRCELNDRIEDSVIFKRNERRRLIRAWKARRKRGNKHKYKSTERWRETRGRYSRHLHLYGVSSKHCALYAKAHNVSRVLLKLLANDVDVEFAGNWSSPTRVDQASTLSLNGRVTNYLGNNHPTISFSLSSANGEPTFRN